MTTPAQSPDGDPWLLTPGPLTTSGGVKRAMLHDLGSRDQAFIELTRRVCAGLLGIAGAGVDHACVPLQGSGTFAVEAMLGTMLPRAGSCVLAAPRTCRRWPARARRREPGCRRMPRPRSVMRKTMHPRRRQPGRSPLRAAS